MEIASFIKKCRKTLKKIGIEENYITINTTPKHDGSGHVEKDKDGKFHWITTERGEIIKDEIVDTESELAFLVYENITFEYSAKWELQNRVENQDSRILLFTKHLELLELIDKKYVEILLPKYKKLVNGFKYRNYT